MARLFGGPAALLPCPETDSIAVLRFSAWAAKLEHVTGRLKAGLAADLVVLDRDFLAEGPDALLRTAVRMTMMNGEVVYSA